MKKFEFFASKRNNLIITATTLIFISQPSSAIAYPQVEMQSCIANAVNATMAKGLNTTIKKIEQYCDCSLKRIIDEGRDVRTSLDYCNELYVY